MKKISIALTFAVLVLFGAVSFAHAWPDQPPTRAFISGPGITGQIQITDPAVLGVLRMGGLEDLTTGVISEPASMQNGYQIIRYFDGSFRFADLTFYPGTNGARSHIYFQDGPQLNGDHTPFNNRWLYATAAGDAVIRKYLDTLHTSSTEPPLLVRTAGSVPVLLAYNSTSLQPTFILPNGLRSSDGEHYYAAFDAVGVTSIHAFNLTDGTIQSTFALDGSWKLSAISAQGRWLALTQIPPEAPNLLQPSALEAGASHTAIAIMDTTTGKLAQTVALEGKFDVDALDANGTALFLVQHGSASDPAQYQVRLFDLTKRELVSGAIVDKRETDEVMVGYPWDAVATPDGTWLFTLYLRINDQSAFIHALNLKERYAWCIDLPAQSETRSALQNYTIALAPNGKNLYALNSALGTLSMIQVGDADISRTIQFAAPTARTESAPPSTIISHARVSRDSSTLFFTDGYTVWQFNASTTQFHTLLHQDKPIIGLVTQSANLMLIVNADHTLVPLPSVVASEQSK